MLQSATTHCVVGSFTSTTKEIQIIVTAEKALDIALKPKEVPNILPSSFGLSINSLTITELTELRQSSSGNQRSIGRLSHSLLPIQITTLGEFDYHKALISNQRDIESSPIFDSLIKSGFLKGLNSITLLSSNLSPNDLLRYYSYETLESLSIQQTVDFEEEYLSLRELKFSLDDDSYKNWISEAYLKRILSDEYTEYSLEELMGNHHIINELLKVEPVYYNVLMPTVITTSQI
jgi:hypothetical protein